MMRKISPCYILSLCVVYLKKNNNQHFLFLFQQWWCWLTCSSWRCAEGCWGCRWQSAELWLLLPPRWNAAGQVTWQPTYNDFFSICVFFPSAGFRMLVSEASLPHQSSKHPFTKQHHTSLPHHYFFLFRWATTIIKLIMFVAYGAFWMFVLP